MAKMKGMSKRERVRRILVAWNHVNEAVEMCERMSRMDDNDRINLDTEISDAEKELKAVREGLWPEETARRNADTERRW